MRSVESAFQTALAQRSIVPRWFFRVTVKDFDTAAETSYGWWTGAGDVTASIKDGLTGATVSRQFRGAGVLQVPDAIRLTSDLSIQPLDITLNGLAPSVEDAIRGHRTKQAPVQLHVGLLSTATRALIGPAEPMFVGFLDENPIVTPAVGGSSTITIRCVSHTRELRRTNLETRSKSSQRRRLSGDKFYDYTGSVGAWVQVWGTKGDPIKASKGRKG